MSIVEKLLGQGNRRTANEYEELDIEQYEDDVAHTEVRRQVHIAEIRGQEGVMDVKDLVYDGDIVLADISHFNANDKRLESLMEEFRQVTNEVGGDIVQKGDDQLIITPGGIAVSREKIAR
jgi:SepF-like predicted cell division protein (DUF552 family)